MVSRKERKKKLQRRLRYENSKQPRVPSSQSSEPPEETQSSCEINLLVPCRVSSVEEVRCQGNQFLENSAGNAAGLNDCGLKAEVSFIQIEQNKVNPCKEHPLVLSDTTQANIYQENQSGCTNTDKVAGSIDWKTHNISVQNEQFSGDESHPLGCITEETSMQLTSKCDSGKPNAQEKQASQNVVDALVWFTEQESVHTMSEPDSSETTNKHVKGRAAEYGPSCITGKLSVTKCDSGEPDTQEKPASPNMADALVWLTELELETDSSETTKKPVHAPAGEYVFPCLADPVSVDLTSEPNEANPCMECFHVIPSDPLPAKTEKEGSFPNENKNDQVTVLYENCSQVCDEKQTEVDRESENLIVSSLSLQTRNSDKISEREAEKEGCSTPGRSSLNGQFVKEPHSKSPNIKDLFDERLIIGKSVIDKHGKLSIRNISMEKFGSSRKGIGAEEQINKALSDKVSLPDPYTRRALFPSESISEDCDIQENHYGNTVMFSLKRKLGRIHKRQSKTPEEESSLSPVQKKVMLALRNRGSCCNGGEPEDVEGVGSTVFLLKSQLSPKGRKNAAKRSPRKPLFFISPLKKKQRLGFLPQPRADCLSSAECLSPLSANAIANADMNEAGEKDCSQHDETISSESSLASPVSGASDPSVAGDLSQLKKGGLTCVQRRFLRTRIKLKRLYDKQRYIKRRMPEQELLVRPNVTGPKILQPTPRRNTKVASKVKPSIKEDDRFIWESHVGTSPINTLDVSSVDPIKDNGSSCASFVSNRLSEGIAASQDIETISNQSQDLAPARPRLAPSKLLKIYKKQRYSSLRKTEQQLLSKRKKSKSLLGTSGPRETLATSKVKHLKKKKKAVKRQRKTIHVSPWVCDEMPSSLPRQESGFNEMPSSLPRQGSAIDATPDPAVNSDGSSESDSVNSLESASLDAGADQVGGYVEESDGSSESDSVNSLELASLDAGADQVGGYVEEEPVTPVSRFMKKMNERNENYGIRVRRTVTRASLDKKFSKVARSRKADDVSNPTFKRLKNYSGVRLRQNVFWLHQDESQLRSNVARRFEGSSSRKAIEAQCLIKWCLLHRRRLIGDFKRMSESLAAECEDWLSSAEDYPTLAQKSEAILGVPQHNTKEESYFYDTIYKDLKVVFENPGAYATACQELMRKHKGGIVASTANRKLRLHRKRLREAQERQVSFPTLAVDEMGRVGNVFPGFKPYKATEESNKSSKKNKNCKSFQWDCSSLCKIDEKTAERVSKIFQKLKLGREDRQMVCFLRSMNECKNLCRYSSRRGHSQACRLMDRKNAPLVTLENLKPHYPRLRSVYHLLGKLRKKLREIDDLDSALYKGHRKKLEAVAEKAKIAGGAFTVGEIKYTDEDALEKRYEASFHFLRKKMEDLPLNYCFSCEIVRPNHYLRNVSKLHSIPDNGIWKELYEKKQAEKKEENEEMSFDFICDYCLKYIRNNKLPPVATSNKMKVPKIPACMRKLNTFEKVLVQRTKVFQVVIRAGTVSGKNIPNSHRNSKVVGRAFHLPLPLEQTIARILRDEQAIMSNQELYFLVRGLPSRQKVVWEYLVDKIAVLETLRWLKNNNPLYAKIELPQKAEDLLNNLEDIRYDDPKAPCDRDDRNEDCDRDDPPTPDEGELYDLLANRRSSDNSQNDPNERERQDDNVKRTPDDFDGNADPGILPGDANVDQDDGADAEAPELVDDFTDGDGVRPENSPSSNASEPQEAQSVPKIAAMLTQKNKDDPFYDDLTTVETYTSRENKTAAEMFQMLKVQASALDSRAPLLDAQCFPDLYPDGKNYFHEDREVTVEFSEFVKAKLMSRDPRFRLNKQYLFFLFNQFTNRQIAAGIYQTLNITRAKYTVGEFLKKLGEKDVQQDLSNVFSRVRNTKEFWKKPQSQLLCMIDNSGPATWFFTYSPSLHDDAELGEYLRTVNGKSYTAGKSTAQLIAEDPVSVSQFCDHKLRGMLDFLTKSKDGPLGEVTHYGYRREYQGRGTQHFHMLLWVKNAPVLGKSSSDEVAEFIQKYVTCAMPDKNTFPSLYEKVTKYQQHRDNSYCRRTKTNKSKSNRKARKSLPVCRFGFPRPVTDKFILRDVATSVAGRRNLKTNSRLYDLPRKEDEVRINDYNPAILLAVKHGNMDLQFVGETSGIIVRYISKYVCKAEESHMKDVFDDVYKTKSQYSRLWSVASRGLQSRECHALEVVDGLLGLPLFGTDSGTVFRWVDNSMNRSRKLKTGEEMKKLAKKDPNSYDLFCPNTVDDHYPNRPVEMENVSLYDYVRYYDIVKVKPTRKVCEYYEYPGVGYLRKREVPCLVNHYHYDVRQKPEEHFYGILVLYKPWRTIDELKGEHKTFTDAFEAEKDSLCDAMEYHDARSKVEVARDEILKLIEEKSKEFEEEGDEDVDPGVDYDPHGFRAAEAEEAMREFREVADLIDAEDDLASLESQLNEDQLRVYSHVKAALQLDTPMRHFVSGVGGTGKSFLIKTIAKYVREELKKDVAIGSPTGLSSFSIQGQTLHRLLSLPVQHGKDQEYERLLDSVLNILRAALKNTVLLIIDEISMVSSLMLMFIHLRLSEIFDTFKKENAFFGNIHILVMGDLLQLPPVAANCPFQDLTKAELKKFSGMSNFNLWQNLFTYDELRINMRQKTDPSFSNLLANVRIGLCSPENVKTLLERKHHFEASTPEDRTDELAKLILNHPRNPVCLLPTRKMCKRLNDAVLRLLDGDEIVLEAQDSIDCRRASEKSRATKKLEKLEDDASRTAGLEKTIVVKIGARVMLLRNIDVTQGYVNGASGTIEKITKNPDGSVKSLSLKMQDSILELAQMKVRFEIFPGVYVHRKGFPITLSYGITIHKSQGLSLDCCFADVGNAVFAEGQTYVALSRVKTLRGLNLINFDPERILVKSEALKEYERLRLMTPHLKSLANEARVRKQIKKKIHDDIWAPCLLTANPFDGTPPPVKKIKPCTLLPPFENMDGVACYANVTLQCLLSYEPLRSALRRSTGDSALKKLADQYVNNRAGILLSASDVRVAVTVGHRIGTNFAGADMQRPVDFFMSLACKSDIISRTTRFTLNQEKKCSSCKTTFGSSNQESVLQMPTDRKKVSEFLNSLSSWEELKNFVCPNCKQQREAVARKLIEDPSDLLVIEILLWDSSSMNKTRNFQMTAVPSTNLVIGQSRYRLHAAVFHTGKGLLKQCHYTAIARLQNTFILADDSRISECRWPRGSKDAFLLFYARLGNVKSQSTAAAKSLIVEDEKEDISENELARPLPSEDNKVAFKVPPAVSKKKLSVRFADEVPTINKKGKLTSKAPPEDDAKLPVDRSKEANASVRAVAKGEVNRKTEASTARAPLNVEATQTNRAVASMPLRPPRFINEDNACYANATLQCLLSCETLRSALSDSAGNTCLKKLATVYLSTRKVLTSRYVRREVSQDFIARNQEDAQEFLTRLISCHDTLLEKTTFYEVHEKKCDKCNATVEAVDPQTIFALPTDHTHRTVTELLNESSIPAPLSDYECAICKVKVSAHKRSWIRLPNELLIIQCPLFERVSDTVHEKNVNFRVTSDRIIFVDGHQFKLHGAVFHHGGSLNSGHYTAIINLAENFVKADDKNIEMSDWPAGSEGAYLLFYLRIA